MRGKRFANTALLKARGWPSGGCLNATRFIRVDTTQFLNLFPQSVLSASGREVLSCRESYRSFMNRQFLVTAMLFLLVITGYNQFVALPRARAAQEAAEAQLKKSAEEAAKESASAALLVSSSSASI